MKAVNKQKHANKKYIWVAVLASLCFTIAALIRRFHSDHTFFTNTIITITFLICYIIYLVGKGILTSWDKEYMTFPWYIESLASPGQESFSKKVFFLLIMGGILQFSWNNTLVYAFNRAIQADLNTGICMSLYSCNSLLIAIASYFMFQEHMHVSQIIGILLMLGSVTLVSLYSHRNAWYNHYEDEEMS